jgi:hypothetical protein
MTYNPTTQVDTLHINPEVIVPERATEPASLVERIGMFAIMRGDQSQPIEFASGAVGYTKAQVHIEADLSDSGEGQISVRLPAEQGNVLVIPRPALIDTLRGILPYGSSVKFNGEPLVLAIARTLSIGEIGGVRYDAAISYADDQVKQVEEIVYASAGSQDVVKLHIPRPRPLPAEQATATEL